MQARELAAALDDVPVEAVYTSPLARAVDTAAAIAGEHDLDPIEIADLREIDRGSADGLSFDEYPKELQAAFLGRPLTARFPGGETYEELRDRICPALEKIANAHRDGTVTVVTHAGPIRAALAIWLRIPDEAVFRIDQRFGAVNVVDWLDGVPLIRLVNGTSP